MLCEGVHLVEISPMPDKEDLSFLSLGGYYEKKRALMLGKTIKIIAIVINPDVIGL